MGRSLRNLLTAGGMLVSLMLASCPDTTQYPGDEAFPRDPHLLLPDLGGAEGQIAAGEVTGIALEQPIAFPHYTHVTTLNMQCEFCHSEARKSIHAGVPPVQTCMNCHSYVKKDSPEVQKIAEYCGEWDPMAKRCVGGTTIPWNKVHDLPDYVYFAHKRHVRAGVECTECHGDVASMGQIEGDVATNIMVRRSSLQMGWCLDCHATHPSIDENYKDSADLRRAELKDCWTCHK